jgi:chlorite dismutase
MPRPIVVTFRAGDIGAWRIDRMDAVTGDGLLPADRLDVFDGHGPDPLAAVWELRGVTSNERYVERPERTALTAVQEALGRPASTCAALIPIRKSDTWWELTQEERREVLEGQSRHIALGLEYLPGVARRLHHSRDLGEPFDFVTWFEYEPDQTDQFDELLARLRTTEEWTYVDREIDVRLTR